MQLSPHFTLEELTRSEAALRRGLDNTPPPDVVENLRHTAAGLELVRALLGAPIHVNSGYRGPVLNGLIGGAPSSQHVKGEAVDFVAPSYGSPLEICRAIAGSDIVFDQLIQEGSWVHVSFTKAREPRRMALTAHFKGGKASYTPGV